MNEAELQLLILDVPNYVNIIIRICILTNDTYAFHKTK